MNNETVTLRLDEGIAFITMDDGKNNVVSPSLIDQLNKCLDEAERTASLVILTGRNEVFSAGFDLGILRTGVTNTFKMLVGGFALAKRIYNFPLPVIAASNGHTIAMGVFLVLAADYRLQAEGDFRITANEVAIGLTMPFTATELCRLRLKPAEFQKAVNLAFDYSPASALEAGFVDELVPHDQLQARALEHAQRFLKLDLEAHKRTKLRSRGPGSKRIATALRKDIADFVWLGIKRAIPSRK